MDISREWAKSLSKAFKQWCERRGYKPYQMWREFDSPETQWKHIINGDNIVSQIEIYAAIFYKTGLTEADPTKIPPLVRQIPSGDRTVIQRAWSESEFLQWLRKPGTSELANYNDIGVLADRLFYLLETYVDGKVEERDTLASEHGSQLRRLWGTLNTLVAPRDQREKAIRMRNQMKV